MNKFLFFQRILLALSTLSLTGCFVSPKPVYRLQPVAEETRWLNGAEVVRSEDDSVEVAASFLRQEGRELVFDVEIANFKRTQILVDPAAFYYQPVITGKDTLYRSGGGYVVQGEEQDRVSSRKIFAVDPEARLLEIDQKSSREQAGYTTNIAINTTLSLLDLFADIATIGKEKTAEEIAEDTRYDLQRETDRIETEIDHENRVRRFSSVRERWEFETLRKTSLNSEESLVGTVYFPVHSQAKLVKLYFPVGGSETEFSFRQRLHYP